MVTTIELAFLSLSFHFRVSEPDVCRISGPPNRRVNERTCGLTVNGDKQNQNLIAVCFSL